MHIEETIKEIYSTINKHKRARLNPTHIMLNPSLLYSLVEYCRDKLYSVVNERDMTFMGVKMIFSHDIEKYDFIVGYDKLNF